MGKKKYYVVWKGRRKGIFETWQECFEQINGFAGAQYKAFDTLEQAQIAIQGSFEHYKGNQNQPITTENLAKFGKPINDAFAVDAAFNGKLLEYRCVYVGDKREIFHFGPVEGGSNNVGEFLALVHCLAYQKKNNLNLPIYSDSYNAIKWVRQRKSNITVDLPPNLKELVQRAEKWLVENDYQIQILKWQTEAWGEIPADFNRK